MEPQKHQEVSDMVLLNGSPLQDISTTQFVAGVMVGSRWLSEEFISAELEKLKK